MFSVIAILEHFLLLEALKDSKIPCLFLTDLVSVEFHLSQKKKKKKKKKKKSLAILFFAIKKMNQLNYYWKICFLHLSEIWGKMELPGMNYSSFLEN